MEKAKRFTIRRVLLAAAYLAIFCSAEILLFNGKWFYKTLNDYSGAVSRGDQLAARDYLQNLQYFYELNKKLHPLGLDGVISESFFKDAQNYQSAYDYLTGNYEKVIKDLQGKEGYWAPYMRANAKWRLAQGIFDGSLNKSKDKKTIMDEKKQAIEMIVMTKDDYERAIKNDSGLTLPPKWNYDMSTDPSAIARALAPKPIKVRSRLGEGGNKGNNPGDRDGDAPGKGTLDLDKKGGNKPGPSPNPGAKREG